MIEALTLIAGNPPGVLMALGLVLGLTCELLRLRSHRWPR